MEIVLLWLDELDDLVISGLSLWQGLRRFCLMLGFVAASGLHVLPLLGFDVETTVVADLLGDERRCWDGIDLPGLGGG